MQFALGTHSLTIRWLVLIPAFLVLTLMIKAGFWQLDRAAQKRHIQQALEQTLNAQSINWSDLDQAKLDDYVFQTVNLTGQPQLQQQFLLDNVIYQQTDGATQVGYEVLLPVQVDRQVILINRGWIAGSLDRQLPVIPNPDVNVTRFSGRLTLPEAGFQLGQAQIEAGWPARVQTIDYAAIQQRLSKPVVQAVIQLDPEHSLSLVDNWVPVVAGPEKHYSYAVQWFAMSAAFIVLLLFVSYQKSNKI